MLAEETPEEEQDQSIELPRLRLVADQEDTGEGMLSANQR